MELTHTTDSSCCVSSRLPLSTSWVEKNVKTSNLCISSWLLWRCSLWQWSLTSYPIKISYSCTIHIVSSIYFYESKPFQTQSQFKMDVAKPLILFCNLWLVLVLASSPVTTATISNISEQCCQIQAAGVLWLYYACRQKLCCIPGMSKLNSVNRTHRKPQYSY